MPYESYFADPGTHEAQHLLVDWRWLVGNAPLHLFRATVMGDLFLLNERGEIHFLDMVDGKFEPFARNETEFWSKLEDTGVRRHVLSSFTVRGLRSEGRTLGPGECFSPDKPLVLGGDLSSENIAACSLAVHASILGQLHRQLRELPPGGKVSVQFEDEDQGPMSITGQMLDIYSRFGGDIDGFAHSGRPEEHVVLSDEQWYNISALLQELALVKGDKASSEYAAQIQTRVSSVAGDESVERRLWEMAR